MSSCFINDPEYKRIKCGLEHKNKTIHVSTVDMEKLKDIFAIAVNNTPTSIDVDGFELLLFPGMAYVKPRYRLNKEKTDTLLRQCIERREKIMARSQKHDAYETAVSVHDIIVRNVKYRDDGMLSHSMAAPLVMKTGVCDGISKAYKFVMDGLGIPCIVVSGKAHDPETMRQEPHAWNMLEINGKWCHVDVTFDACIKSSGILRYDYFGLSDNDILLDHFYDRANYPIGDGNELDYYRVHHCFIANKRQLKNYFQNNICERNFIVKVGENVSEKEILDKIIPVFNEAIKGLGESVAYKYSCNYKQKVVQISIC